MEADGEFVGVCPSMALGMIAEGKSQVVPMDHKTIFCKVMAALGAKDMPVFTTIDCGEEGVKVAIKVDVSCAKYYTGERITTTIIEGEASKSKVQAEKSAVLQAVKHLSDKHLIKVRDYSSRVANDIASDNNFGDLNAAIYSAEKIIDKWEANIGKCTQLALALEGKEPDVQPYVSLSNFIAMLLDIFKEKMTTSKTRIAELEFQRKKYLNRSTERYHATLRKGYLQDAIIMSKDVLDYVLGYVGAGKAQYTNGPTSYGMVKGVVQFNMPQIKGIDFCGNLTIKGKCTSSKSAEEDAAFQALLYMEDKYKLKIVDLNHDERVLAEKESKILIRILEQLFQLCNEVKTGWGNMIKLINSELQAHSMDPVTMYSGPDQRHNIKAFKFCAKEVQDLAMHSNNAYSECEERFQEITKLQYKLDDKKIKLLKE